jgi:hypothetical protein
LVWLITYGCKHSRASISDERGSLVIETWQLWERETVTTYELRYDPKKQQVNGETEVKEILRAPHGFKSVPFVCLDLPAGQYLMAKLAPSQIEHFRINSRLSWAMTRSATATPVFHCESQSDGSFRAPTIATGHGIIMGKDEKLSYASPPADVFEVMHKQTATNQQELHRLGQQMSLATESSATSIGRSAESKIADERASEQACELFAALIREFIGTIYTAISRALGDATTRWSVEGLRNYRSSRPVETVQMATQAMALSVPSETYTRQLMMYVASQTLPSSLDQSLKRQIESEILSADLEALTEPESEPKPIQDDKRVGDKRADRNAPLDQEPKPKPKRKKAAPTAKRKPKL